MTNQPQWSHRTPWIGVDLDGTLAYYKFGVGQQVIGDPIQPMMQRLIRWIEEGRRIKIFTARVAPDPDDLDRVERNTKLVHDWCAKHKLPLLEVTATKDPHMIGFYDDRCVAVAPNTGVLQSPSRHGLPV